MTSTPNTTQVQTTNLFQDEYNLSNLRPIQTDIQRTSPVEASSMWHLDSSYTDSSSQSGSLGSSAADDIVNELFLSDPSETIDISDKPFESSMDFDMYDTENMII